MFHGVCLIYILLLCFSLLTLSQVISKLGSSSSSHINFRDSKLTRLLQPSLSGNARMAVICCATPSELYLEETRSTLQFASRAKLVKTRAQINEVMDERSMIKKLQRELAEAKRATSADIGSMKQVKELESKATHAETAAMILQEKFERLTASILRGGVNALINDRKRMATKSPNACEAAARFADLSSPSILGAEKKRRRQSDGILSQLRNEDSPLLDVTNKSSALATFTPLIPRKVKIRPKLLENSSSFQLVLLKDALAAKSELTKSLNARLAEWQDKAGKYESSLDGATKEIIDLKRAESSSEEAIQILSAEKEALEIQRQDIVDDFQEQLSEKEKAIQDALGTIESILKEKEMFQETIAYLETEREDLEEAISERDINVERLTFENNSLAQDFAKIEVTIENLRKEHAEELQSLQKELDYERERRETVENDHDHIITSLTEKVQCLENLNEENKRVITSLEKENESLQESNDVLVIKVEEIGDILRMKDVEYSEMNQDHSTMVKKLNDEIQALQESLITSENEKDGLIVSLAQKSLGLNRSLSELRLIEDKNQEQVNELQQSYKTISKEYQEKANEVVSLNDEVAMLHSQQQGLIISLAEIISERNHLCSHNCHLEKVIREQEVKVRDLDNKVLNLQIENKELMSTVCKTNEESNKAISAHLLSLQEKENANRDLRDVIFTAKIEYDHLIVASVLNSLDQKNEQSESSMKMKKLKQEIESQIINNSTAQNLVKDLEEKCVELESTIDLLQASSKERTILLDNFKLEKNSLITELELSKAGAQQLTEQMNLLSNAINLLRSQCIPEEDNEIDTSSLEIIESVADRFQIIERKNFELEKEHRFASITLEETEKELLNWKESVEDLQEKNRDLSYHLQLAEALAASLSLKENEKDFELDQLREENTQKEDLMKNLEFQIAVLTNRNEECYNELASLKKEYEKLSERFQLTEAVSSYISSLEDVKNTALEKTELDMDAKDDTLNALSLSIERLRGEKETISKELEEMKLKSSDEEGKLISQLTQEIDKGNDLKSSLDEALKEKNSFETSFKEAIKTIEVLETNIFDLQCRLEESQMNFSVEKQKSLDAFSEAQMLKEKIDSAQQDSIECCQEIHFKEQIDELQELLLAANAREEEANRIAIAADQELQLKEKELEEVSFFASECESNLKKMEEKINYLQSQSYFGNTSNNGEVDEIIKDMEVLMEEKLEVEKKMEELKIAFQHREDELKNDFENERRQLLQDARERIESLKQSLEDTESDLIKHKEDARTTRQELISLEEQLRSDQTAAIDSDEKVLHLSEQLSASEATIDRLQQDMSVLQEEYESFKVHVASAKDALKQSYEGKLSSLREEISLLKDEVHTQTLKAKSAEEKLNYFEQEANQLQNELKSTKKTLINEKEFAVSKLKEELALGKVQVSRAEAQMFELTEKLEEYRLQIENLKQIDGSDHTNETNFQALLQEKQDESAKQAKVVSDLHSDIATLKETIEKLNFKIQSKDERISSLKKKALTKEHVNMIKTLKTERTEYKNKADKYKNELDILKSKAHNPEEKQSTSLCSQDLDELQSKQIALEEKLRKYVAHCEFQKKEKDAIADLVKSTFDDDDDSLGARVDEDLGGAITSLCERLKSLEDELECLMNVKQDLSHTAMKLELAEESRFALQISLEEMKEKVKLSSEEKQKLTNQLKSVNEEVCKLKEKLEKLQQISASVQGSASELEAEKNRQVSYLEKENLQFLAEVKQLKQEIRKLKSERKISSIAAADDEPTEDLGFLSKFVSNDKENNPNQILTAEKSTLSKPRYELGAGEGDLNDDNTQECHTS